MNAEQARAIAQDLIEQLRPHCERIEIAGSLRRRKPEVHDLDLVLEPLPYQLPLLVHRLNVVYGRPLDKIGPKYCHFANYQGIPVDLYLAEPHTWATLLLIRTGSKNHNILLCRRARERRLILHANGEGFGDLAQRTTIPITSEAEIFERLGLPYREPEERD